MPAPLEAARERLASAGRLGRTAFLDRDGALDRAGPAPGSCCRRQYTSFRGSRYSRQLPRPRPVVPDRLAYREYVDAAHRYGSIDEAVAMIGTLAQRFHRGEFPEAPDVSGLSWSAQRHAWVRMLK
ncbi:MAG: hypothetical protein U5O39_13020 [Gammaproteobacteria bacterium]|nr:hypothetical protein [Gammaproteobacteria bacterium]